MKYKKCLIGSLAALACFSSVSAAETKTLEEAIKNVKVSGFLRYRYNDVRFENLGFNEGHNVTGSGGQPPAPGSEGAVHNWRANADFNMPISDDIALNLGIMYGNSNTTNVGGVTGSGLGAGSDGAFGVTTYYATFAPKGTMTTIDVGKMRLDTPIHDTTDDRGTGVMIRNQDIQDVSFYAGIFDSWSLDDGGIHIPFEGNQNSITKEYHTLGTQMNKGGLDAHLMYSGIKDLYKYLIYGHLGYSTSLFHIKAQYAMSQLSDEMLTTFVPNATIYKDHILMTLDAGVKFSPVSLRVGYIGSGADGYKVSLDDQGSYSMGGQLWNENSILGISYSPLGFFPLSKEKLSVYYVSLGLHLLDNEALKIAFDYVGGEKKNETLNETIKFQEITPFISYQYNPKLDIRVYYAMITAKKDPAVVQNPDGTPGVYADAKQNRLRTQIVYKF